METLISTLRKEIGDLSKRKKKKISLAYLLLKGVNDSYEELEEFVRLVSDLGVSATLLYYNDTGSFKAPSAQEYEERFLFLKNTV